MILGAEVSDFEDAFAAFQGVRHVVGVGSGTDALELALRATGVDRADDVILPANTFYASAAAVERIGARPVVVDCDPVHLLLDPDAAAAALTERTTAVMPVHLYGQMAPRCEYGVPIVEDCAQAHGATQRGAPAGAVGAAGATSFHPHKNLAAWGDAGAVLTQDSALAEKVRRLRQYGADAARVHVDVGWNSRLDTVQAIVLMERLRTLAEGNERRRAAAAYYTDALRSLELPVVLPEVADGNVSTWHLYVVRTAARDEVAALMRNEGIGVSADYAVPIHLQPAFAHLGSGPGTCPVAEMAATQVLSLPLYPSITRAEQDRVVERLASALAQFQIAETPSR